MSNNTYDSPIQIQINSELENLWNSLGIDPTDRNLQIQQLISEMKIIYINHIDKLKKDCINTREEIENVINRHRKAMEAFGMPENEISQTFPQIQSTNLLRQLNEVSKQYEGFKVVIADRVQKIDNLVHIAKDLFNCLEIPQKDRGEFNEIGEIDFTRERVERFKDKIEELKLLVEKRKTEITSYHQRIQTLLIQTGEGNNQFYQSILSTPSVGITTLNQLKDIEIELKNHKEQRVSELSEMAVTITHLWDILSITEKERKEFLSKYSDVGPNVIKSCKDEILRLSKLRDEKLPNLIAQQRQEVTHLWEKLHIAVESRPIFVKDLLTESDLLFKEYQFLEQEILRLKRIEVEHHLILETINQREEIINEYQDVLNVSNDPNRLTSRERGMAQQLIKEEKARRRYKTVLPKVDKKLSQMLIDYKKKNGKDFEWDGKPYLEKIYPTNLNINIEDIEKKGNTLPKNPKKVMFLKNNENIQNTNSVRVRSNKI